VDSNQLGQIAGLLNKRAGQGGNPRQLPQAEIEQLIQAAALIGNGRALGGTDEQVIGEFARKLIRERDRRVQSDIPAMIEAAEADLVARGQDVDDIEVKSQREILNDQKEFGFAFEDDAQLAQDGKVVKGRNDALRQRLQEARGAKKGQKREARIQNIQDKIANNDSQQKIFDFGLIPIVGEDEDPIQARERGRLVRRGDQVFFEQGGGFIEGPNGRIEVPGKRVAWDGRRDERGEPILPDGIRMNADLPVAMNDAGMQQLIEQDRAMAASEARKFERFMRDDLNTEEMAARARMEAGKFAQDNEIRLPGPAQKFYQEVDGVRRMGLVYPHGPAPFNNVRGGAFEGDPQTVDGVQLRRANQVVDPAMAYGMGSNVQVGHRAIGRAGIPGGLSVNEAQEAILGHLQARKAARGDGRRQAILRAINDQEARAYAGELLLENKQPGQNIRAQINDLGAVKDKRADMGLQLGNQKTMLGDAIRVERPDGSFEFVDRAGNPLYTPQEKTSQALNPAAVLNAPDGANNAFDFVLKNEFEDRGAQNFGDESILAQFADKGAGGGIEQVDIQGELRDVENKVAARLGIEPKRIKGARNFQAAMNAVIEGEKARGNALIRLVDGEKVKVSDPGIEEALLALKIQPAQAKRVANALKQADLAVNSPVEIPGVKHAGHNVVTGVNDPRRGGDRLDIAKDVQFQNKLLAQGIKGDAARPFVGQLGKKRAPGFERVMLNEDGSPMDPIDVRNKIGERNRQNREKLVARKAKQGKKQIFGPADDRKDVGKIRAMQEGNIFAQVRADRAAALAAAAPRNERGRIIPGANVEIPGAFVEPRGGVKRVIPGLKRKGEQELLPRPVRPNQINSNPSVTEEGGLGNVSVPEGFKSQADRRRDRRRIAIGGGISAAVLGTLLGLSNMNREEEEQMV
jgi:hypothetical protein